jgi:aminoglycoside phosphotransferase (APT) family kinase protein
MSVYTNHQSALGAMSTALRGHAHPKRWAWHPPAPKQSDVSDCPDVAAALLSYLNSRFAADVQYKQEPTPVPDGWETYIYQFELEPNDELPTEFRGPLTLRMYAGCEGIPRGRKEFAVQRRLEQAGYPVPAPVCWEEDCTVLGGPFQIMEQVPGPTMLERMIYRPWALLPIANHMATIQARLHKLPVYFFPASGRPLLERSLDDLQCSIDQYELEWLRPGLDWLRTHPPAPPWTRSILHLDFHPLNLIHRCGSPPVVLDWDSADVGDPHADIATTIMLIRCAPNEGKNGWERFMIGLGRDMVEFFYLCCLRRHMVLDEAKLAYYEAWAVLRRLCRYERLLKIGPEVVGTKPSFTRHVRRDHVDTLCRHFGRVTGVRIRMEESLPDSRPL